MRAKLIVKMFRNLCGRKVGVALVCKNDTSGCKIIISLIFALTHYFCCCSGICWRANRTTTNVYNYN